MEPYPQARRVDLHSALVRVLKFEFLFPHFKLFDQTRSKHVLHCIDKSVDEYCNATQTIRFVSRNLLHYNRL
jgi:hypothetical protein